MMKTAQDIIIAPVITEASMAAIAQKKYTFRVMKKVNKQEIAAAVEELFGVKVAKVNTINVRGRSKRMGLHSGKTADWKKAIVTLKADSKGIEFFESMLEPARWDGGKPGTPRRAPNAARAGRKRPGPHPILQGE